jgi:DTW domain-containing protein YfiP
MTKRHETGPNNSTVAIFVIQVSREVLGEESTGSCLVDVLDNIVINVISRLRVADREFQDGSRFSAATCLKFPAKSGEERGVGVDPLSLS